MLCPNCRRQIARGVPFCTSCGAALNGASAAFDLVLRDGTRVPVLDDMTIGRAPGNTLELADPTVSRHHARITSGASTHVPSLEDTKSSHGTWLDGRPVDGVRDLRDGSRIRLGDQELVVERRRASTEAGRTIVVPPGQSLVVPAVGAADLASVTTEVAERPRLRSGYALKRLDASEGSRRWVLKDLRSGRFRQLSDADAELLRLLDGRRALSDLVLEAERQRGAAGPARLARLLADFADRRLLAGDGNSQAEVDRPDEQQGGLFRPRELSWAGAGELFEGLYGRGGWLLFTRPATIGFPLLALVGAAVFAFLVIGRYGTPFVVAHKVGVGGLVFVLGRFAVVAFHELAHGLAMASFGRRVRKAGLKLLLIFPYAYVDTSEIWFEPRRRRIAVSAAGPMSDFVLGALFSLCCLALAAGTVRDIFFQLAFGAYLGALFNLNPMLERDGYHILVDVLREPGLRRRAREQIRASLSGHGAPQRSPVLARYALLSLVWSAGAAIFAAALSLRYEKTLEAIAPKPAVWTLLVALWVALFTPVILMIGSPLRGRLRSRATERFEVTS